MNRRQLIKYLSTACAAAGLKNSGRFAFWGHPKPKVAVIHAAMALPPEAIQRIQDQWKILKKKVPDLPECVIMDRGLTLEFRNHV